MLRIRLLLSSVLVCTVLGVKAQLAVPFITIDPDGYTNVREQPNATSKVIGRIYKHQLFENNFGCEDVLSEGLPQEKWKEKWMNIYTDSICGYMYKKYLLEVTELPYILGNESLDAEQFGADGCILENDSVKIIVKLQPFNPNNHDGLNFYGYGSSLDMNAILNNIKEFKELSIILEQDTISIPWMSIKDYVAPSMVILRKGPDNVLYLCIKGAATEDGTYGVWLSIVNKKIYSRSFECFYW